MKINIYIPIILLLFALYACEEVIDVDVNTQASELAVEGRITTLDGPQEIKLSKTIGYFSDLSDNSVKNATVIVYDDSTPSNRDTLKEVSPGVYHTKDSYKGVIGRKYFLDIRAEGKKYFAEDSLKWCVKPDSIVFKANDFDDTDTVVCISSKEPIEKDQFYKWEIFFNGEKEFSDMVQEDEFVNGNYIDKMEIFDQDEDEQDDNPLLVKGVKVTVYQLSLTEKIYTYYSLFYDQIDNGSDMFSTPPANAKGNVYLVNENGEKIKRVHGVFYATDIQVVSRTY